LNRLKAPVQSARVMSVNSKGKYEDNKGVELIKLKEKVKKSRETTKELKIELSDAEIRIKFLEKFILDNGLELPEDPNKVKSDEEKKR